MTADRCGFCGSLNGPFTPVEGLFTVLMCPACLAARARGRGPYPDLTDEEMRAGLDLLPTWALEQKAAANRQVIAEMRARLERGEPVVRMYGRWGLPGCNARPRSPKNSSATAGNHPHPTSRADPHSRAAGMTYRGTLLSTQVHDAPARVTPGASCCQRSERIRGIELLARWPMTVLAGWGRGSRCSPAPSGSSLRCFDT